MICFPSPELAEIRYESQAELHADAAQLRKSACPFDLRCCQVPQFLKSSLDRFCAVGHEYSDKATSVDVCTCQFVVGECQAHYGSPASVAEGHCPTRRQDQKGGRRRSFAAITASVGCGAVGHAAGGYDCALVRASSCLDVPWRASSRVSMEDQSGWPPGLLTTPVAARRSFASLFRRDGR